MKEKPNIGRIMVLGGGLLMLASFVLPWMNFVKSDVVGYGNEITPIKTLAIMGIVPLLIGVFHKGTPGNAYSIIASLLGGSMGYKFYDIADLMTAEMHKNIGRITEFEPGIGAFLAFFAFWLILIGGFIKVSPKYDSSPIKANNLP